MGSNADADLVKNTTMDGITRIYLIIVGLAITEALKRTFSLQPGDGAFLGLRIAETSHLLQLVLFVGFIPTVIRFAHGSILHLKALATGQKWWWDMFALLSQAILFYIAAIAIGDLSYFLIILLIVFLVDTLWIFFLKWIDRESEKDIPKQWWISNLLLVIGLIGLIVCPSLSNAVIVTALSISLILSTAT